MEKLNLVVKKRDGEYIVEEKVKRGLRNGKLGCVAGVFKTYSDALLFTYEYTVSEGKKLAVITKDNKKCLEK